MAVVGMKRLTFVGLSEDRDDIFSRLMDLGVVEISSQNSRTVFSPETDNNTPDSQEDSFSAAPQVRELEHKMFFLISLIERLSQYDERKKPLFKARRHISKSEMARVARRSGSLTEFAKGVSALDGRIQAVQNDMNRLKNSCNDMALWQDYPYDLSWKGTVHTGLLLLTASPGEYEAFRGALTEAALAAQLVEIKREETRVQGVVFYHRDCEGDLLSLLSRFSVNRADLSGYQGTAVQCRAAMEAELEEKAQELSCLEDRLAQAAKKLPELEVLHDYYAIEKEKLQASSNILQTRSTFLFEGWIPAKFEKLIRRFFSKRYLCSIDIREAREEEQPPTALANGRLGSSIEGVVLMYSAPSYDEADPSWISALFYIIFFGLMLSDAGYGLLMTIACAVILKTQRLEKTMKSMISLFLYCGISTMMWGALFGGWFGDLVSVLSDGRWTIKPLWFNPVEDPERLLAYSLLFGVIHIFVGLGMKAWNYIRKGKWVDAVCDVFFWYIFYTGEVLFLLPYVPAVNPELARRLSDYGLWLLVIGFVPIFLTKGRKSKNLFGKFVGGISGLYSLVDMLSDVLSYSRLMALGLATSVIIQVFNEIGMMGGRSIGGFILFALVFLAANAFNIAINAISTYVNASRLMYIEFFGKFYEGAGREFAPLTQNTSFVIVDGEDIEALQAETEMV